MLVHKNKCFDDNVYNKPPIVYTTETAEDDVAQVFIDLVEKDVKDIFTRFKYKEKMIFEEDDN